MMSIFWLICISVIQRSSGQHLDRIPSAQVDIANPGERGLIPAQPFWPSEFNPVVNTTSFISSKDTKPKRLAHAQAHLDEVTGANIRVQDHGYRAAPEGTSKPLPPVILNALEELKANLNASKPISNENNNAQSIPKVLVSNQPQFLPNEEESSYTNFEPILGNAEQSRKAFLNALHRLAVLTGNKHNPQKQPLETNFSFQVDKQPAGSHTDNINPKTASSFSSSPQLNSVTFTTNSDVNQGSFISHQGGNTGAVIHKNTLLPNGEHFSHQTTTLFKGGNHSLTHSGSNFLNNGLNSPTHIFAPNIGIQHHNTLDPNINHVQHTHFTSTSDNHQHSFDSRTPQLQEPFISFSGDHSNQQPQEESLQFVKSSEQTGSFEHEIQPHQLHSSTFSEHVPKTTESPAHTHFQVHTNDQSNRVNPFNSPPTSTFEIINNPTPTGIHSEFQNTPNQFHHKPEQNSKQLIPFNVGNNPLQNERPHSQVIRPFSPTGSPKLPDAKSALPSGRPQFPAERPLFPENKPELPENRPLLPATHTLPTGEELQGEIIQLQVERPVSQVSHPDRRPQQPIHQIETLSPFHSAERPQHAETGSLNRRPLQPGTESVTEKPTFASTQRPQNLDTKPINTLQSHTLDEARPSTIPTQPNSHQSHSFRPNHLQAGTPQTLHRPAVFSPPTISPTLHHQPLSQNLFALHQHTPSHAGVHLQQNNHIHQNDRPIHTTTKQPTILTTLRPSIHTTTVQPTQLRGKGLKQDDDPFSSTFEALNKQAGKNLQENDQNNASEEYEEYYYYYYDYDDDNSSDTLEKSPEKTTVANFPRNHENTRLSSVNQSPPAETFLNGGQTPLRRPRPDGPITPPPSFLPPRQGHQRKPKVTPTQEPLNVHHVQEETSKTPINNHKQPRPSTNFRRGHSFTSTSRPSQEIPHSIPTKPNQNINAELSSKPQTPQEIPHIFTTTHRPPTNLAQVISSSPQPPPFSANVHTSTHRPPQELTHVFPSTPRPIPEIPQGFTSTNRLITNAVQTLDPIHELSHEAVQASTSKPPRDTIPKVTFTPRPNLPQGFPSTPHPLLSQGFHSTPQPLLPQGFPSTPQPLQPQGFPSTPQPLLPQGFHSTPQPLLPQGFHSTPQPLLPQGFPSTPQPLLPQGFPSTPQPLPQQGFPSTPHSLLPQGFPSTPRPLLPHGFSSTPHSTLPHIFNFAPVTPQIVEPFNSTPRPPQSTVKTLNPHLVPTTFPQSALIKHTPLRSSTDSEREHLSASTTSTPKQISLTESPSTKPAALPKPPSFEITAPPRVEPPSFKVKPPPKSISPQKVTARPSNGKTQSTLTPSNIITPQPIAKSPVFPFAPPLQSHRGPHVPIHHSPLVYVHPQFQPQFHPLHAQFQMPFSHFGVPAQYQAFVQPNAQFAHTPLHFRNAQQLFHSVDPRLQAQLTPQFQTSALHPFQTAFPQQFLGDPRLQFRVPLNHVTRTPLKSPLLTSKTTNIDETVQDTSPSTFSSSTISDLPVHSTVSPNELKDTNEPLDLHEEAEGFDFTGIDYHRTVLLPPSQLLRLQQNNKRLLKANHRLPVYFPLSDEFDETVRQGRDVEDLYDRSLSKERMNATLAQQPQHQRTPNTNNPRLLQQPLQRRTNTNLPIRRTTRQFIGELNRQPFRSQQIRISRRKSQTLPSKSQVQEHAVVYEPLTKNETTEDQLYKSEYQVSSTNITLDESNENISLIKPSKALSNHTVNAVPSTNRKLEFQTEVLNTEKNLSDIVNSRDMQNEDRSTEENIAGTVNSRDVQTEDRSTEQNITGIVNSRDMLTEDRSTEQNITDTVNSRDVQNEDRSTEQNITDTVNSRDVQNEDRSTEQIITGTVNSRDVQNEDRSTEQIITGTVNSRDLQTEDHSTEQNITGTVNSRDVQNENTEQNITGTVNSRDVQTEDRSTEQNITDTVNSRDLQTEDLSTGQNVSRKVNSTGLQTENHSIEQNISIINITGLIRSAKYINNDSSVDVIFNRTGEVRHTPEKLTNYTEEHIAEKLNSTKSSSSEDQIFFSEQSQNVISTSTVTSLQNPTTSKAYSTISKQPYRIQAIQANTTEENTSQDESKNTNPNQEDAQSTSNISPEFNISLQNNPKEITEEKSTNGQTNIPKFYHNNTDISMKIQEKQNEEYSSSTLEISQTTSKQNFVSSENVDRTPGSNVSRNSDTSENSAITIHKSTSDLPSNSSVPDTPTTAEEFISHNTEAQIRLKRTYSPINTTLENIEENIDMSDLSVSLEKPEFFQASESSAIKRKSPIKEEIGAKQSKELENSEPDTSLKFNRLPLLDLGVIKVFRQENDLSQSNTNNESIPTFQSEKSDIPSFTTEGIQEYDNIPNVKGWRRDLPYPEVQIPMPSPALSGLPFYIKGHRNLGQFFMFALD